MKEKKYLMYNGVLSYNDTAEALAKINNVVLGPKKRIRLLKNREEYYTDILTDKSIYDPLTLKGLEYRLTDSTGKEYMKAYPHYAPEDDPSINGWPLNRLPRIDTLEIDMNRHYVMTMLNASNYSLCREDGKEVMRIIHRGLIGGWHIEECAGFSLEIICGLYEFCRYLEQENEFAVV